MVDALADIDPALCGEDPDVEVTLVRQSNGLLVMAERWNLDGVESAFSTANEIIFVIGSSHGLDDSVKNAADLKLSVSKLTFPHQLMRVVLLESIYRCLNIIKGTKYHK